MQIEGELIMTTKQINKYIENIIEPSRNQSLGALQAIKHLGIDPEKNTVILLIEVGKKNPDVTNQLTRELAKIVKIDLGFAGLVVDYEQSRPEHLGKKVKILGIASGKGGVGKSTVTANLAYALTRLGKKVGILDADIYGANMPKILDCENRILESNADGKVTPITVDGIEMVSTEYMVDTDRALLWRGPMLGKVLKIFFDDTLWSPELEYLLVDLPPGTGDVMMDLRQFVADIKLLLVTTPHPSASHIAIKAGFAAKSLQQELLGVIENMSWLEIDNHRHKVFGEGGGEAVSEKLLVPLLGQIPLGQPTGENPSIFSETDKIGIIYLSLAKTIMRLVENA